MLGYFTSHDEYRNFIVKKLTLVANIYTESLLEYEKVISKLFILNLDSLKEIIKPLYSNTGRPSNQQAQIFKSFIIIIHLKISLNEWIKKVKVNYVCSTITEFDDTLPAIASYYDFIDKLIKINDKSRMKNKKCKPSKKLIKDEKLPHKKNGTIQKLLNRIIKGRILTNRLKNFSKKSLLMYMFSHH